MTTTTSLLMMKPSKEMETEGETREKRKRDRKETAYVCFFSSQVCYMAIFCAVHNANTFTTRHKLLG